MISPCELSILCKRVEPDRLVPTIKKMFSDVCSRSFLLMFILFINYFLMRISLIQKQVFLQIPIYVYSFSCQLQAYAYQDTVELAARNIQDYQDRA